MRNKEMNRNRITYALFIILVILMGLASRKINFLLPAWLGKYPGDVLWALMIFLIFGLLFKKASTNRVTIYALLFSYGIEISQLYHASWIDSLRRTIIGRLVLGLSFSWVDLVSYTIGIAIGFTAEKLLNNK